jgi:hypothetical protein
MDVAIADLQRTHSRPASRKPLMNFADRWHVYTAAISQTKLPTAPVGEPQICNAALAS